MKLSRFGSTPGVRIKWKGEAHHKPEPIQPGSTSQAAHERLETNADEDIRRISGVNESALGDTDIKNQSGIAIQARQRQAVISVQLYMNNFKRSKMLLGKRRLEIYQNHYTEERFFRMTGTDGSLSPMVVNQLMQDPGTGVVKILNDITVGKYLVNIKETPLSASFKAAQFEEMIMILEKARRSSSTCRRSPTSCWTPPRSLGRTSGCSASRCF
jgi:hypothetical protein